MAVKPWGGAFVLAALLSAAPATAQTVTTEVDVSAGRSTEQVNAGGMQIRLFGPIKQSDWRIYAEGTWGGVWSTRDVDAFGAAYPYDGRFRPMEMYVERTFKPRGGLFGVRAGRYRMPFGISGRSDHAYMGFTRAPLMRYGSNWALSNNFLEAGVDVIVGRPSLYVEASLGTPSDESEEHRHQGLDTVVRAQAFSHSLIVGASYVRTQPSMSGSFVRGRMTFSGIDARWMLGGVQIRGEWIDGRPFDEVATRGGYVDGIVHLSAMGPVTALARIERLDYDAGQYSAYYRRLTVGARLRISASLGVQVNLLREQRGVAGTRPLALDASATYSIRF
jgi:hypothetical protein